MYKINIKYESNIQFIKLYLSLFQKEMELTSKEFNVLVYLVNEYSELKEQVKEPYLTELVFSTDRRKKIYKQLNIEESNFNNILKALKDKGIFGDNKDSLLDILYPKNNIIFNFYKEEQEEKNTQEEIFTESEEIIDTVKIKSEEDKEDNFIKEVVDEDGVEIAPFSSSSLHEVMSIKIKE